MYVRDISNEFIKKNERGRLSLDRSNSRYKKTELDSFTASFELSPMPCKKLSANSKRIRRNQREYQLIRTDD